MGKPSEIEPKEQEVEEKEEIIEEIEPKEDISPKDPPKSAKKTGKTGIFNPMAGVPDPDHGKSQLEFDSLKSEVSNLGKKLDQLLGAEKPDKKQEKHDKKTEKQKASKFFDEFELFPE